MSKLVIDITAEEIDYARRVGLLNPVELSMIGSPVIGIKASEHWIEFSIKGKKYKIITPNKLRVFLHRFAGKHPVRPIKVAISYGQT